MSATFKRNIYLTRFGQFRLLPFIILMRSEGKLPADRFCNP